MRDALRGVGRRPAAVGLGLVAAVAAGLAGTVVASTDCNNNGIPDHIEIAKGLLADCNGNGIPDICEYAGVELAAQQAPFGGSHPLVAIFTEVDLAITDVRLEIEVRADLAATNKFVQVKVGGTLVSTLWVVGGAACPATPSVASLIVPAATFNAAAAKGVVVITVEASGAVSAAACGNSVAGFVLHFLADRAVPDCLGNGLWDGCDIALDPAIDCNSNGVVDLCEIAVDPARDCNGNGVLDSCEIAWAQWLDCNGNGVLDSCEIAWGWSSDCNWNGVLDDCEIAWYWGNDCNWNGVLDWCEIYWDPSLDCNGDWVLDECQQSDCNWNGVPDIVEICADTWGALDCNENGVIDECELNSNPWIDCNANWVIDWCEIAKQPYLDCDGNGVLDSCEVGPGRDCDGNGVVDQCELAASPLLDCDGNGVIDACDIATSPERDCDGNGFIDVCEILARPWLDLSGTGVLDACEIAADPSVDCDGDGVIDTIQMGWMPGLDCNGNSVIDACEIALDPMLDSNLDGTLDACSYAVGDLNLDGVVDGSDLAVLLILWGTASPEIGDLDGDGIVDGADLGLLLLGWGHVPLPPVITAIVPPTVQGGEPITISGLRLGSVPQVRVGGVLATDVTVLDAQTVIAVAPNAAPFGLVDIVVSTAFGSATSPRGVSHLRSVPWATVVEGSPDASIVTSDALRAAIVETGFPWRIRDNVSDIEMLLVPAGAYTMGCSPSLLGNCDPGEYPLQQVAIEESFYLGRYPVTQSEWTFVMGTNPSQFQHALDSFQRPVERVTRLMVDQFLSFTGLRLPTEPEWEYACRGGTTTAFSNGSSDDATLGALAWFSTNSGGQTRPVGQKLANRLGFHDMHGNVWEWVDEPPYWGGAFFYFIRGGSFSSSSKSCRSSMRALSGDGFAGVRVARTP